MGITDIWKTTPVPRRKASWAAYVERQQPTQFIIERAKPCEVVATTGMVAFARHAFFGYHEDETIKRVLGFDRMTETDVLSEIKKRHARRVARRRVKLVIRQLVADQPSLPPTPEEHLRQVEGRIQSITARLGEMLQTMTSQTEEATRLVQDHRAKWQVGNVVVKENK